MLRAGGRCGLHLVPLLVQGHEHGGREPCDGLNITYALWGVLFGALFTDVEITRSLVIGAAAIFVGMFLVIGNPRDIINLRNVSS